MTPEALARLHARAFPDDRPWSAAEFATLLHSPHVFLCGRTQAFALGRAVAGEAELLTLATDPDHRRRGLASACLRDFLIQASDRGAARAFLEVASDNLAAIALYSAAGFVPTARRKAYYPRAAGAAADALILSLEIAEPR